VAVATQLAGRLNRAVSTLGFMEIRSARSVFHALRGYGGHDAYAEVLSPWLEADGSEQRDLLGPLRRFGEWRRTEYVFGDLLEQACAFSRLSDVLLLGFQPPCPDEAETCWAHELFLEREWPRIDIEEYLAVFAALDMTVIDAAAFDPFFHEIVDIEQATDPSTPIQITHIVWPGLMLGELLFNRAGVRIRAGADHAVAGIADRSPLQDVFLRRHRATQDDSLGWGHNSQWKTDFRRDYLTSDAYRLNIDADTGTGLAEPEHLTPTEADEALRHRCLIRRPQDPAALHSGWPGDRPLTIPRRATPHQRDQT
jgi:hypothetical protein